MFFVIDSTVVENGKFSFSAKLELPELYGITHDTAQLNTLFVFIDNKNDLQIKYDTTAVVEVQKLKGLPQTNAIKSICRMPEAPI